MTNDELVDSLRKLADFYEAHPELQPPYFGFQDTLMVIPHGDLRRAFADYARAFGAAEKQINGEFYNLRATIGAITVEVTTPREKICTRRVVETKHVPAQLIPASMVPEHDEEIVEWDCPESLLAVESGGAA